MNKVPFKKKLENFWYYYKVHTIVAVFVIISLTILITQCSMRVNPDMTVIIASTTVNFTDEQQTALEQKLAEYTEDINNDGKKVVSVENFYISNSPSDSQLNTGRQQKLTALLASSDTTIYILDDGYYDSLNSNGELSSDLSLISSDSSYKSSDGKGIRKVKLSELSDFNIKGMPNGFGNLNFTVRNFADKTPVNNTNKEIQNSVAAARKILSNKISSN